MFSSMATSFGISPALLDSELSRFIASGKGSYWSVSWCVRDVGAIVAIVAVDLLSAARQRAVALHRLRYLMVVLLFPFELVLSL
jgi:hypothetical protein